MSKNMLNVLLLASCCIVTMGTAPLSQTTAGGDCLSCQNSVLGGDEVSLLTVKTQLLRSGNGQPNPYGYTVGQKVQVKRTSGVWAAATIKSISPTGVTVGLANEKDQVKQLPIQDLTNHEFLKAPLCGQMAPQNHCKNRKTECNNYFKISSKVKYGIAAGHTAVAVQCQNGMLSCGTAASGKCHSPPLHRIHELCEAWKGRQAGDYENMQNRQALSVRVPLMLSRCKSPSDCIEDLSMGIDGISDMGLLSNRARDFKRQVQVQEEHLAALKAQLLETQDPAEQQRINQEMHQLELDISAQRHQWAVNAHATIGQESTTIKHTVEQWEDEAKNGENLHWYEAEAERIDGQLAVFRGLMEVFQALIDPDPPIMSDTDAAQFEAVKNVWLTECA